MTDIESVPGPALPPSLKVNGRPLQDTWLNQLLDARVELTIGLPGSAELRFYDNDFEMVDSGVLSVGTEVEIGFSQVSQASTTVFKGEIVSNGIDASSGGTPVFTVQAFDKSHRLGRNVDITAMRNLAYSDIVKKIAAGAGLTAQIDSTNTKFEDVFRTTDAMSMIDEIALRTGMIWWVDNGTLQFRTPKRSSSVATLDLNIGLLRLRCLTRAAEAVEKVEVRGWDMKSKQPIVAASHRQSNGSLSSSPAIDEARKKAKDFGGRRIVANRSVLSEAEAKQVAQGLQQRATGSELTLRGEAVGTPVIKVCSCIDIAGVGTKLAGTYFVTSVEHVYSQQGYVTRFTSGTLGPSTLADVVGGGRSTGDWRHLGPTIGVVTNVGKGSDAGKVKVKLPSVDDQLETGWARVLGVGAGNNRGLMMMPSTNDEVLVAFERGDLRRPVVLGSLWNDKDAVPNKADTMNSNGKTVEWVLRSVDGHMIRVADGSATKDQKIEIILADQATKLVLCKDKVELHANSKPLELKSGTSSITFDGRGAITIEGDKIALKGTQEITLKGTKIEAKADASAKLEGATVDVKASAKGSFDGGGVAELTGKMVKIN